MSAAISAATSITGKTFRLDLADASADRRLAHMRPGADVGAGGTGGVIRRPRLSVGDIRRLNDYQGRRSEPTSPTSMPAARSCLRASGAPFDTPAHTRAKRKFSVRPRQAFGWCYPPLMLLIAAALALMPMFLHAGVAGRDAALYLLAMRGFYPRHGRARPGHPRLIPLRRSRRGARHARGHDGRWLLLALSPSPPCSSISVTAITAFSPRLIGFGLVLLDRRPIAAGILFGSARYKPQFGLMIHMVLIASGPDSLQGSCRHRRRARSLSALWPSAPRLWSAFFVFVAVHRVCGLEPATPAGQDSKRVFPGCGCGGARYPCLCIQGAVTAALAAACSGYGEAARRSRCRRRRFASAVMIVTPIASITT